MGVFESIAKEIHENAKIIMNPGPEQLRSMAKHQEVTSEFGSACYVTKVRNRSARLTEIVHEPKEEHIKLLKKVKEYLKGKKLICLERTMGQHPKMKFKCRIYITEDCARLGYEWLKLLFEPEPGEPDVVLFQVSEWPEQRVLVDPENGITFVLGLDYFGETKKGNLRMALYRAKRGKGCLGLHAATKKIRVKDSKGNFMERGFVLFGLSGTGKTSLTVHNHSLEGGEGVSIVQDDMVIMDKKGYCYGTENGFFLKTEGLTPDQKVLYNAAISPEAVFENVYVDENGKIDFLNYTLTTNGRGVIPRGLIAECSKGIDLERTDCIVFITRRNDIVPPVAKLTPEQAAAAFMLGESIETSAGDPTRVGQAVRCVGTNPFIVGPLHEEGHVFLDILRRNPGVECFLLNTGRVGGSEGDDITIDDSSAILRELARGSIKWKKDPHWGYDVPSRVNGVKNKKLNPANYYSRQDYIKLVKNLMNERRAWLANFHALDSDIKTALVGRL